MEADDVAGGMAERLEEAALEEAADGGLPGDLEPVTKLVDTSPSQERYPLLLPFPLPLPLPLGRGREKLGG